jgi:beta-glucanase (GH16 family)
MMRLLPLNQVWMGTLKCFFQATRDIGGMAFIILLLAGKVSAANILTNPGFETANLSGWSTFGGNNSSQTGGDPHGGTSYYKVYGQFIGANNYTGIYQEQPSVAGTTYSADGWAYSLASDGGGIHGQDAIWLEVSFRDAADNALALYRSSVVTGDNIAGFGGLNTWFDLQITNQCAFDDASDLVLSPGTVTNTVQSLVAPPGTVYVRYQVVFQQGADNANGSMYFDDLTLNQTDGTGTEPPPASQWNIVWDDEFNGTAINSAIWKFEAGNNNGWGNSEREYYTGRTNNAYVSGGLLHIVARQESTNGFSYTSARMKTEGLYAKTYGRIQWRARLPAGTGMWPALWMMGTNISSVGWPSCGEIDVVENNGANPTFVQGSLHSNAGGPTAIYNFTGGDATTNFHTYLLDWDASSIRWYVDGHLYETQTSQAPFNAPFFFLMNLAVGGQYVGNPSIADINAGTAFPAEMQVDYIRVYEQTASLQISVTRSNGQVILTWPADIVCRLQAQTNSLTNGGWADVPNPANPLVLSPDPASASVFFRLVSP